MNDLKLHLSNFTNSSSSSESSPRSDSTGSSPDTITDSFDTLMSKMQELSKELLSLSTLFLNPFNHITELAEHAEKQIDAGNIQLTCGVDQENIEIPASPSTHFVERDELIRDLGKIAWLPRSSGQKLAPGCSVGLTLLIEHLLHRYYNIRGGEMSHHLKTLMKVKELNGGWEHCTIHDMLNTHFTNILNLLGVAAHVARGGSSWHYGLGVQSPLTPAIFQDTVKQSTELLITHVKLMDIGKFDRGHEYLESINLFNLISQAHPKLLLQPVNENPTLSTHFIRLHHRTQVMIKLLTHFDALRTKQMTVHTDVRYANDLKTGLKMMLDFFNEAGCILGKSGVAKGELTALGECYRFVRKWAGVAHDPTGNFRIYSRLTLASQKMSSDLSQRTMEEQGIMLVANQLSAIEWMHTSILDETLLCVLDQLMANQKVESSEVLKILSRLQEVIMTIENATSEASRLMEAPFALLANETSNLNENLRSIWKNDFLFICNYFIKPLKRMLEVRSIRIKEATNPGLESASTLREVLSVFGANFRNALTTTAEDISRTKLLLTDNQIDDPSHTVWKTMHDLIQLQQGAFEAAVGSVEALVGEGLEALREKEMEAQREAATRKNTTKKPKSQKQEIDDLMKEFDLEVKQGNKKGIEKKKAKPSVSLKKSKPKPQPSSQSPNLKVLLPPPAAELVLLAGPLLEIVPIEVPQIARAIPKTAFMIAQMKRNLEKLETSLPIADCDPKFRKIWRAAQINNTLLLIQEIKEWTSKDNVRLISGYDQVDLSRRLVEAILEIVLATYPVTGAKDLSCLRDTGENGHRLHAWIRILMNAVDEVPAYLRETIWSLREVPFILSDANSCVNYPHSTSAAKANPHPLSRSLLDWLLQLEKLNEISTEQEINLSDFAIMRKQTVVKSLYFAERVLTIMLNPHEAEKCDLPDSKSLKSLAQTEIQMAKGMPLRKGIEKVEEDEVKEADLNEGAFSIRNRSDALTSISMALKWIKIRLTAPVQGIVDRKTRTEQRDLALRNTVNYLLRLIEHLSGDRFKRPQSTLLGQLRLIRRILKETAIAALFHHREGGSIAQYERYTNNPVAIVKQVRAVQGKIKQLPQLGRGLSVFHTAVSYPVALTKDHKPGFEERELRKLILHVKDLSSQMENAVGKKPLRAEAKELLDTNEKERVFPCLQFLLEMLISDFPKAREL